MLIASAISLCLLAPQDRPEQRPTLIACVYQVGVPGAEGLLSSQTEEELQRLAKLAGFDVVIDSGIHFAIHKDLYSQNRYSTAREILALSGKQLGPSWKDWDTLPLALQNRLASTAAGGRAGQLAADRINKSASVKVKVRQDLELVLTNGDKSVSVAISDARLRSVIGERWKLASFDSADSVVTGLGELNDRDSGKRANGKVGSLVVQARPVLDDYRLNSLTRLATDVLYRKLTADRALFYGDMRGEVTNMLKADEIDELNLNGFVPSRSLSIALQVAIRQELESSLKAYGFADQEAATRFWQGALVGVAPETSGTSISFLYTESGGKSYSFTWHIRTFEDVD